LEKYVRIGFVVSGLLVWMTMAATFAWLLGIISPNLDKPLLGPEFSVSNLMGLLVGGGLAVYLWFHPMINKLGLEVANELRNVTWPTWPETRVGTIVVVVTTIVVSLILGLFDAVWGALTSLIYRL
jgi:preprotein translocase SecE subunit